MSEVEDLTQRQGGAVPLRVLRNRAVVDVEVPTVPLSVGGEQGLNQDRLIFALGLLVQTAPLALSSQRGVSADGGVYVSARFPGSPASVSGPPPTSRITHVDGQPTPSLNAFLAVLKSHEGKEESCVIAYKELSGSTRVCAVRVGCEALLLAPPLATDWSRRRVFRSSSSPRTGGSPRFVQRASPGGGSTTQPARHMTCAQCNPHDLVFENTVCIPTHSRPALAPCTCTTAQATLWQLGLRLQIDVCPETSVTSQHAGATCL